MKKLLERYKTLRPHIRPFKNKQAWKLFLENWRLLHVLADLVYGHKCVLTGETVNLDLDHCFSRTCGYLFFDIKNVNYLHKGMHSHKTFNGGGWVDKEVDNLTRKRNGEEWWDEALRMAHKTCNDFRMVWYQEGINEGLKEDIRIELEKKKLIGL